MTIFQEKAYKRSLREAINALSQGKSIKKVVEKAEQRLFYSLRIKRKKALIESAN
jgi:hypothetical protein